MQFVLCGGKQPVGQWNIEGVAPIADAGASQVGAVFVRRNSREPAVAIHQIERDALMRSPRIPNPAVDPMLICFVDIALQNVRIMGFSVELIHRRAAAPKRRHGRRDQRPFEIWQMPALTIGCGEHGVAFFIWFCRSPRLDRLALSPGSLRAGL